jgi:uncharacterized membrane protein
VAGIGFALNRILQKRTYTSVLQAYGYAAAISSGPWVLSIISLALLGFVSKGSRQDLELFYVAVTHVFGFSLILTGPLQLLLTRYTSDRLYDGREEEIFPAFLGTASVVAAVALLAGSLFFFCFTSAPLLFQLGATELFISVSCLWLAAVLLSAIKDYHQVLGCFAVGYTASFLLAWGLRPHGVGAVMCGFAGGQLLLFSLLTAIIYRQFGRCGNAGHHLPSYFTKHWALAGCGLLYNLGIWSDKFIHWWFSPHNMHLAGALYASPFYDEAVSLSFVSVAPGMAVFLLSMETKFATHYETFFKKVLQRESLASIRETRR